MQLTAASLQLHLYSRGGQTWTVWRPPDVHVCQTLQVEAIIWLLVGLTDGIKLSEHLICCSVTEFRVLVEVRGPNCPVV